MHVSESGPHSLPKVPDNRDDGWTDNSMAELEKELRLPLEQADSSVASTLSSPRPLSVAASQDEIKSREDTETTGSRPEELRNASPHATREGITGGTVGGKWGGVEMQQ